MQSSLCLIPKCWIIFLSILICNKTLATQSPHECVSLDSGMLQRPKLALKILSTKGFAGRLWLNTSPAPTSIKAAKSPFLFAFLLFKIMFGLYSASENLPLTLYCFESFSPTHFFTVLPPLKISPHLNINDVNLLSKE